MGLVGVGLPRKLGRNDKLRTLRQPDGRREPAASALAPVSDTSR